MTDIKKGILKAFKGSWTSGMATLVIDDIDDGVLHVNCENAPTVRALEGCFGNVIGSAHNVKEDAGFMDKEVFYSIDDIGILEGFTPVDEASDELLELWEEGRPYYKHAT